jgi:hypothetical protein
LLLRYHNGAARYPFSVRAPVFCCCFSRQHDRGGCKRFILRFTVSTEKYLHNQLVTSWLVAFVQGYGGVCAARWWRLGIGKVAGLERKVALRNDGGVSE